MLKVGGRCRAKDGREGTIRAFHGIYARVQVDASGRLEDIRTTEIEAAPPIRDEPVSDAANAAIREGSSEGDSQTPEPRIRDNTLTGVTGDDTIVISSETTTPVEDDADAAGETKAADSETQAADQTQEATADDEAQTPASEPQPAGDPEPAEQQQAPEQPEADTTAAGEPESDTSDLDTLKSHGLTTREINAIRGAGLETIAELLRWRDVRDPDTGEYVNKLGSLSGISAANTDRIAEIHAVLDTVQASA